MYFRGFGTPYLCFLNEDAAYFFLSPAFVCAENGIQALSLRPEPILMHNEYGRYKRSQFQKDTTDT